MIDPLRRYVEAATGLTQVTKSAAERIVKNLVQQGAAAGNNPQELVEHLLERSRENREALMTTVRSETRRLVKSMGVASQDDVERLEDEVRELRRKLRESEAAKAAPKSTAKKATKKAAKKSTAKKPAKKSTKKKSSGGSP
ncbi:MAG: hypothetical protein ACRDUY_07030 [Nitriliruptorales bacterium]